MIMYELRMKGMVIPLFYKVVTTADVTYRSIVVRSLRMFKWEIQMTGSDRDLF